jgi:hypothetical protein
MTVQSLRTLAPERQAAPALSLPSRRDALPEHTRYVDTGCEVHPSCLSCPLVRCRYDEPGGFRAILGRDRDRLILQLRRDESLTVDAIARRVGVSRRTVFRVLARGRHEGGAECR